MVWYHIALIFLQQLFCILQDVNQLGFSSSIRSIFNDL